MTLAELATDPRVRLSGSTSAGFVARLGEVSGERVLTVREAVASLHAALFKTSAPN